MSKDSKVAAMRAMREARHKARGQKVEEVSVAEVMEQQGHPIPVSKSQAKRLAAGRAAKESEEAGKRVGKKVITVYVDPELHKEVKIAAAEEDAKVEAWVEAAIRQELKARSA